MGNTHGRIGGIYVLAARATGTKHINTQIIRIDFNVFIFRFRKHCHGGSGSMHAPCCFCFWYTLHSMYTRFSFEMAIYIITLDIGNHFFKAPKISVAHTFYVHTPPLDEGIIGIHFEQITCK